MIDKAANLRAIHHVNLAHGAGVDAIRALVPGASVGAIHNRQRVFPEKDNDADRAAAALLDEHWNRAFPDPQPTGCYPPQLGELIEPYVLGGDLARICRPVDWFGLNHYGPIFARADPNWLWGFAWGNAPDDAPRSDIGWPIFPDAFRDELVDLTQRFRLPVYVTENGAGGSEGGRCPSGKNTGCPANHTLFPYWSARLIFSSVDAAALVVASLAFRQGRVHAP